jgi:pimeloyl-ACP methyl ester carboxylesterase
MYFKTAEIEGLRLFYREAGEPSKPAIVLLHGFPSSSYQFHDLIPLLSDRFHVVGARLPRHGVQRSSGTDCPATDLR